MTEISNIQAVSGHKDIKVLTGYIKRNDKELNQVKGCFDMVFYKSQKEESEEPEEQQSPKQEKVRVNPVSFRVNTSK